MNAEQESQFAASYTQKLYVKYCQEKHDLQGDQIAQWPQWLARQVYEAEARTEVLKNGFRHQVEALEVLQEMTGSQNDRNPWLGITAAVGQLQLRVDSLRTQLEEANAVQQGMTEAILGAGVREAKMNAEIRAYDQVVYSLNTVITDLTNNGISLMLNIYDAINYDREKNKIGKSVYHLPANVTEEMKRFVQKLHNAMDHETVEEEEYKEDTYALNHTRETLHKVNESLIGIEAKAEKLQDENAILRAACGRTIEYFQTSGFDDADAEAVKVLRDALKGGK